MSYNKSDVKAKIVDLIMHKQGWAEELIISKESAGTIKIINENPKGDKR